MKGGHAKTGTEAEHKSKKQKLDTKTRRKGEKQKLKVDEHLLFTTASSASHLF
ncbi:MAG: hypothetical protein MR592_00105 [Prevotella sp.]|nr:hypothetical protein [Prevotella sp.]